ncbi:MAG TPA: polysaccharide biosynthesis/export family protein [Gemmatimonadales bacterium]
MSVRHQIHPRRTAAIVRGARRSLMLLAAGACIPAVLSAQSTSTPIVSRHVLQPGDAVRLTVWRKPELSGEFIVSTDSSLRHPLYQSVPVAGVPLSEATERLRVFLSRYENEPQLVIEPLLHVTVMGEVRQPNLYALPPETMIVQAVAIAGGAAERGRLDHVLLRRRGQEIVADLTRPDSPWAQARIESGDQIVITRRRDLLRDIVGPMAAVIGAAAAVANIIIGY